MKSIKDELQNIILGDEPAIQTDKLKKSNLSLDQMRQQASQLKTTVFQK